MSDTHERWMQCLRRTWPEDVPARQPITGEHGVPGDVVPWPDTWRDPNQGAMQCLHCRHYVELSGELGADWGACTNEQSQYDGQLVFEHWTCFDWGAE